jgi:hypothetical protein
MISSSQCILWRLSLALNLLVLCCWTWIFAPLATGLEPKILFCLSPWNQRSADSIILITPIRGLRWKESCLRFHTSYPRWRSECSIHGQCAPPRLVSRWCKLRSLAKDAKEDNGNGTENIVYKARLVVVFWKFIA